jgi:hypothetical protein
MLWKALAHQTRSLPICYLFENLFLSVRLQVVDSIGGAGEDRTRDLLTASQALSQLSYSPTG